MDIEKPLAISNSVYILYLNNLTVLQNFFQDIKKLPNLFFIMSTTKDDEDHRWVSSREIAIMKILHFERVCLMR